MQIFFFTDPEGSALSFIGSIIQMYKNNQIPLLVFKNNTKLELRDLQNLYEQLFQEKEDSNVFEQLKYTNLLEDLTFKIKNRWMFVCGGDVGDIDHYSMRLKKIFVDLKKNYPSNCILCLGNRDINKLRYPQELPPYFNEERKVVPPCCWNPNQKSFEEYVKEKNIDTELYHIQVLKYKLGYEMGSEGDFDRRKRELEQTHKTDVKVEEVFCSFLYECIEYYYLFHDTTKEEYYKKLFGGISLEYIELGMLLARVGNTLVTHSNIIDNSKGPILYGYEQSKTIDELIKELDEFKKDQINEFKKCPFFGLEPPKDSSYDEQWKDRPAKYLIGIGCDVASMKEFHEESIEKFGKILFPWAYCRYTKKENQMQLKFDHDTVKYLKTNSIKYILTGHTPHPAPAVVVNNDGVYYIVADTSRAAKGGTSRGRAATAVHVNGDNCYIYANIGKKVNNDELVDDLENGIEISYKIEGEFGNFTDEGHLIVGLYYDYYICIELGERFFMRNYLKNELEYLKNKVKKILLVLMSEKKD